MSFAVLAEWMKASAGKMPLDATFQGQSEHGSLRYDLCPPFTVVTAWFIPAIRVSMISAAMFESTFNPVVSSKK
jgi:hypothetical protein